MTFECSENFHKHFPRTLTKNFHSKFYPSMASLSQGYFLSFEDIVGGISLLLGRFPLGDIASLHQYSVGFVCQCITHFLVQFPDQV